MLEAFKFLCSVGASLAALTTAALAAPSTGPSVDHVLMISVDGVHAVDLSNYVAAHPTSTLASLVGHGVIYSNALSSGPSDSFPGLLAFTTGGTPKSTGVFYDVSYDRELFAPGSDCQGGRPARFRLLPRISTRT
jgi:arylsulfatase A-like enzyme